MFGRFVFDARALRVAIVVVLAVHIGVGPGTADADPAEAKKIFTTRCTACHTFGKGVKVGPDLKGVTERRQRAWLLQFIKSSAAMIGSGDPIAVNLFQEYKQQRMPDWTDLADAQIEGILDWLAANGPDQQEIDARPAESATLAEIEIGRQLFHGERALAAGGIACASCHSIRNSGGIGGSLGSDLTDIYASYQDGAVTQMLRRPCFRLLPESATPAFLSAAETFYLKAYLRHAVLTDRADDAPPGAVARTGAPPAPGGGASPGPAAGAPAAAISRVAWAPKSGDVRALAQPRGHRFESTLLFLAFPYIALGVLIIGLGVRYALARRRLGDRPDGETSAAWRLYSGGMAWRVGLAITAILHLAGLVIPRAIVAWNGVPLRLYILEGSGFLLGVLALIGWVQIMRSYLARSAASRRSSTGELADGVLVSLLGLAVLSGLVIAVLYRWGSLWATGTLTPYMQSLARGTPATELVAELPFLVRIHTLSWFAMIAVVPFTSLALVVVAAVHRGLLVIGRPFEAAAQAGRRAATRLSPARWLWPEEDAIDPAGALPRPAGSAVGVSTALRSSSSIERIDADKAQEPS